MKLEINANDFCPDNCPYCEPYKASIMDEYNINPTVEWGCYNNETCRSAYKQKKRTNKIYAVKERNIGDDLIAIFDNEEAANAYIAERQKLAKYPVGLTIEAWEVKE